MQHSTKTSVASLHLVAANNVKYQYYKFEVGNVELRERQRFCHFIEIFIVEVVRNLRN